MKLSKLAGIKDGVFPKLKVMPKMAHLTGVKKSDLGLPSFKPKRKKRSVWKTLKNI